MKSYSERCVFLPSVIRLHRYLSKVIERLDCGTHFQGQQLRSIRELRCHELTRAVQRFTEHGAVPYHPSMLLFDGKYASVNHSWLEIQAIGPGASLYILDVYAVGRLPQVQILDTTFQLPHRENYKVGERRDDIDMDIVGLVYLDLMAIGRQLFDEGEGEI